MFVLFLSKWHEICIINYQFFFSLLFAFTMKSISIIYRLISITHKLVHRSICWKCLSTEALQFTFLFDGPCGVNENNFTVSLFRDVSFLLLHLQGFHKSMLDYGYFFLHFIFYFSLFMILHSHPDAYISQTRSANGMR